jgi:hypothetical protein
VVRLLTSRKARASCQSCSAQDGQPSMTCIVELVLRGNADVQRGSGLPVPCPRTLVAALQTFARSKLPALRHPWLRWPATPALRARAPLPEYRVGIRSRPGRLGGRQTLEERWAYPRPATRLLPIPSRRYTQAECGLTRISRAELDWPPARLSLERNATKPMFVTFRWCSLAAAA